MRERKNYDSSIRRCVEIITSQIHKKNLDMLPENFVHVVTNTNTESDQSVVVYGPRTTYLLKNKLVECLNCKNSVNSNTCKVLLNYMYLKPYTYICKKCNKIF